MGHRTRALSIRAVTMVTMVTRALREPLWVSDSRCSGHQMVTIWSALRSRNPAVELLEPVLWSVGHHLRRKETPRTRTASGMVTRW